MKIHVDLRLAAFALLLVPALAAAAPDAAADPGEGTSNDAPAKEVAMALEGSAPTLPMPAVGDPVPGGSSIGSPTAGPDLLRKHADLEPVVLDGGIYYQEIHKGTGRSPEFGQIVYFMIKAYAANGPELTIGDSNHAHPEGTPTAHSHAEMGYRARWTFHGAGGGSFSLGTKHMDDLFATMITGMQEMGTRLVYVPAAQAYGADGYTGHEFQVLSDTDLVFRISLLRVVDLTREEDLGMR